MLGPRERHGRCLTPGGRRLIHVDEVGRGDRGRGRRIRVIAKAGLDDLAGRVSRGAAAVADHPRIHGAPALRGGIEGDARDRASIRGGGEHPAVREDEHVRVVRKELGSPGELGPGVCRRVVYLGNQRVAPVAVDLAGGHQHSPIRQRSDSGIPAGDRHWSPGAPALRDRVEDGGIGDAHVVIAVAACDEDTPVGQ